MAHAQAGLVRVILSPKIVTMSRFQNIPKAMILQKKKPQQASRTSLIANTDRSFKLKQLHFDVTSVVLQSSNHTLQRITEILRAKRRMEKQLTFAVLQLSPLNGSRRSNGTGYNPIASSCA